MSIDKKPAIQRRKAHRLPGYIYSSPGAHYVTLCLDQHKQLFGRVVDDQMQLSNNGKAAQECWSAIPEHFPHVALDIFVVMPNHLHGVLYFACGPAAGLEMPESPVSTGLQRGSLGAVIAQFKAAVGRIINSMRRTPGALVWQRDYWDHAVRTEEDLYRIKEYIQNNPMSWHLDHENPERSGIDPFDKWLASLQ